MNDGRHTGMIYQKLTGIKIDEQMKLWDARGKGYYGEYLLFSELYNKVSGTCKILMNLQIPSEHGKTTEIDLLVIHETGLYVFEAKHYKGTIYGKIDEPRWTQYFRTAPNQSFNSPIMQNRWHIEQLSKLYPNLPIRSFIVFTNEECTLNVIGGMKDTTLCYLHNMRRMFEDMCAKAAVCMNMEQIDEVFRSLTIHSPMQMDCIYDNGVVMNLYDFVAQATAMHTAKLREDERGHEEKLRVEQEAHSKKLQAERDAHIKRMEVAEQSLVKKEKEAQNSIQATKRIAIIAVVATVIVCISLVGNHKQEKLDAIKEADAKIAGVDAQIEKYQAAADAKVEQYKNQADADLAKHKAQADAEVEQYRKQADAEIEQYRAEAEAARAEQQKFAEKWQVVTDFVVDGNLLSKDFVTVSDVVLKDSVDFGNLVKLSCTLTHNGEDFYALIDKSSMFTVLLTDGRVLEFPCYSSQYSSYSLGYSSSVKKLDVKNFELSGFNTDEIAMIKLTNMQIKRIKYVYGEKSLSDYEVVLYTAK